MHYFPCLVRYVEIADDKGLDIDSCFEQCYSKGNDRLREPFSSLSLSLSLSHTQKDEELSDEGITLICRITDGIDQPPRNSLKINSSKFYILDASRCSECTSLILFTTSGPD